MSLKQIAEPIYTQIDDKSSQMKNIVIKGIDDSF